MSLERRINQARARVPSATDPPRVPSPLNIIDFATNPAFLGIDLYPVQATILKIATGSLELLTDFDRDLIATWERGWEVCVVRVFSSVCWGLWE